MKKHIPFIFYILIIVMVSLFIFIPTFNLALFGDDWYFFWRYLHFLGPNSSGEFNHLTYIVTPYGSQEVLMGVLRNYFGFNSTLYYLTSYILRIVASISLLLITYYLTKNKLAAFFAALFFSITPIGLDTTNWVFNMTVYVSITLFNICLYCYLRFQEQRKIFFFITSVLAFYLAHLAAPNRMTGLFIFIILIELFWLLQGLTLKKIKFSFLKLSVFLLVFLFISATGAFPDSKGTIFSVGSFTVINSIREIEHLLFQGRSDFLFYPILTIGKMIIPDTASFLSKNLFIFLNFLFLFLTLILLKSFHKLNLGNYMKIGFIGIAITFLLIIIYQNNKDTLSISSANLMLVGFYTILLTFSLLITFLKNSRISTALFIGIGWTILSFIFTWLVSPETLMPTTHRYLIVSAVGLSIILATIISLGETFKNQVILLCLALILLLLHINQSQKYVQELLSYHSQDTSNKIWSVIPDMPEARNAKYPLVLYLENDGTNDPILYTSLGFGFDYHIALLYNIHELDKTPVVMDNWQNVVSAVTDGKSFASYGYHLLKPVPINHVYAFRLEGKDHLINITDQARVILEKLIQ